MTYTIPIYVIDSVIITIFLYVAGLLATVKIIIRLFELIPGN